MTNIEELQNLLIRATDFGATDLHLTAGAKPMVRINGHILSLEEYPKMQPDEIREMLYDVLSDRQKAELSRHGDIDTAFGIRGIGRFRVNIYRQRGSFSAAIRLMYPTVPTIESAGIPAEIADIAMETSGLVLAAGIRGCGKSTAIAALLQEINRTRCCHILTIEDPVEYLFHHDKSIVNQREVGLDCKDFASGIASAVREDPDVIFIGEMRDKETVSAVLAAAENGHLVFSTVHALSPEEVNNKVVHMFDGYDRDRIEEQLSSVLHSVIAPRLYRDGNGNTRARYRLFRNEERVIF